MASFEFLAVIVSVLGLAASITYYAIVIGNQNKTQQSQLETRQAALFSNLFETFRSIEFRRLYHQVLIYDWKDYDDWTERYNEKTNFEAITAFSSIIMFFMGIGVLVRRGLIDIGLVYELMGGSVKLFWDRYEPVVRGDRLFWGNPVLWGDFEYLYNRIVEIDGSPDSIKGIAQYFHQLSKEDT